MWSLGTLLHLLGTGKHAFGHFNGEGGELGLMMRIVNHDGSVLKSLEDLARGSSEQVSRADLLQLITALLQPVRTDRLGCARKGLSDLLEHPALRHAVALFSSRNLRSPLLPFVDGELNETLSQWETGGQMCLDKTARLLADTMVKGRRRVIMGTAPEESSFKVAGGITRRSES
eukprot:1996286-Prymnesium_polylepis.1